ncbi:RidA family protein [Salmonella enterica subsp. enterica]|nr:RidA family protein [Salmonella enterica subsp. enterica]
MKRTEHNSPEVPLPKGGYSQAVAIEDFKRLVFVSGQVPSDTAGAVPDGFAEQAALVWSNVDAQLREAGMTRQDIVKVSVFLADRQYALPNREARQAYLGDLRPAMSVIICGIFDSAWLLEIEVIAAR